MNAVIYMRVSGAAQIDGTGFDRQSDSCRELASKLGFTVTETFREEAVSGKLDIESRPAFQAMIAHMLDTGTKILLIESLDRLAREYRIQEQLLLYLAAKGLDLYAANSGENITEAIMADPMRKALVQIQGIFAELDKSMIVAKLRKGRERTKSKVGRCEGRKPFGHLPGEAETLSVIIDFSRGGHSCIDIAIWLNGSQSSTRSGKPWRGTTVAKILRRERVTQSTPLVAHENENLQKGRLCN